MYFDMITASSVIYLIVKAETSSKRSRLRRMAITRLNDYLAQQEGIGKNPVRVRAAIKGQVDKRLRQMTVNASGAVKTV